MSLRKNLPLNTGLTIPQIGIGTWLAEPGEVGKAIEAAVRHGYRHIDCAYNYSNQEEVGKALKTVIPSVVTREELFITSKLWNTSHSPALVEKELDETLRQLGTSYLDLYLIHFPVAFASGKGMMPEKDGVVELDLQTSLADTWNAMVNLVTTRKVRAVGVSNCTVEHIKGIIAATKKIPAVNQVEFHPLNPQHELLDFCKSQGIHVTAYSPLGNNMLDKPLLTEHPTVKEIAQRLDVNGSQVIIAWATSKGLSVIPKSVDEEHIKANLQQIELSTQDIQKIDEIGKTDPQRFNIPYRYEPKWDINIYNDPAEQSATHTVKIT